MRGGVPGPAVPWPCPSTEGVSGPRGVRGARRPRPGRAGARLPCVRVIKGLFTGPVVSYSGVLARTLRESPGDRSGAGTFLPEASPPPPPPWGTGEPGPGLGAGVCPVPGGTGAVGGGWPALRALPASIPWLHTALDLPAPGFFPSSPPLGQSSPACPPPPPSRPLAGCPGSPPPPPAACTRPPDQWPHGWGVASLPAGLELACPAGAGGVRVGRPEGLRVPNLCNANSGSSKALGV